MTEPSARVTILDRDWPGRALPLMPGDLTKWLPAGGSTQTAPPPADEDDTSVRDTSVPGTGPILAAPATSRASGLLYFGDPKTPAKLDQLRGALELMGVYLKTKAYAVFWGVTLDTLDDRYLHQVRLVTYGALAHIFKARPEAEALAEQPLSLGAYIETFIAEQQAKWTDGRQYSRVLDGMLGGDGDTAREVLGFGFAVESAYLGVYRLWSRPWLCCK